VCTPLGAAVRAFFGEGGARCHVVRTGDAPPLLAPAPVRFGMLRSLGLTRANEIVPTQIKDANGFDAPDADPATWRGVQHVLGLEDASFLCVPDLHEALAFRADPEPPLEPAAVPQEHFHECVDDPVPPPPQPGRFLSPPRLADTVLPTWMVLVRRVLAMLGNRGKPFNRGDVQLVTSLPLTVAGATAPTPDEWLAWMATPQADESPWWSSADEIDHGEALAHLQAGYPWLVTPESADCPGGVEAPEGTLAGVLARNALARGAFRSAAFMPVARYIDAEPRVNLSRAMDHTVDTPAGPLALAERVCLIGPSPRGPQLHSDMTFATQAPWRPGSVRRLVNVVVNAARRLGQEHAFEPNAEALWSQVRQALQQLGRELLVGGALSSDAGTRAFVVRCGHDTMTQADIDAGRLVAEIELVPAQPILRIRVVLALRDALPAGARAAA
jgi:Bacteriophage tail sheath protein